MKKIVSILLLAIFLSTNFSFAAVPAPCSDGKQCAEWEICWECKAPAYDKWGSKVCTCIPDSTSTTEKCSPACKENEECYFQSPTGKRTCTAKTSTQNETPESYMGITCNEDLLVQGQCKLNIYDTLGIRKSVRNENDPTSVGLFVQDVVLSATFFIGTVVTIALVVSGIMYIFAASSGKSPDAAKKGIIWSLIGLLIVVSSYVIIRLVQYIAKWF